MRSVVAVFCVGAILIAAFFPGAVALCAAMTPIVDAIAAFDESQPRWIAATPTVSPALFALTTSHRLARASLPAARS